MPEDAGADAIDAKYVAIGWQGMSNIFGFDSLKSRLKET